MDQQLTPLLLCLLLATIVSTATSRFIVEKNTIKVISPEELAGEREAAIANYGIPNYGGSLTGVIVYPDTKTNGCDEFDTKFKSKSNRAVILLVDRGGLLYISWSLYLFYLLCFIYFLNLVFKLFVSILDTRLLCLPLWSLENDNWRLKQSWPWVLHFSPILPFHERV